MVGIAVAGLLDPPLESRSAVDVSYDLAGPPVQAFRVYGLDGWLVRDENGSIRAFSATSPHRRCRVIFVEPGDTKYEHALAEPGHEHGLFFDICFNSRWTLDGTRTYGPTPRGLDEFEVKSVAGSLVLLDLTRVKRGLCGEGSSWTGHCSLPGDPKYSAPVPVDEGYTSRFPWPEPR
jgi:hypothetical protein